MKILVLFAIGLILLIGCTQPAPVGPSANTTPVVPQGNDTDSHGCKLSDGYSWCDAMQACARVCTAAPANPSGPMVGNDSDVHGCKASAGYSWCDAKQKCIRVWEEPCEGALTSSQAITIAEHDCSNTGNLTSNVAYNNYTKTWWIDLTPDKIVPGCNPACVVDEVSKTATVNWRCTGAIPPQ